ncbi:putative O-glycosylation ligase, exosortase A system-associated [Ferribacterium limneticum]|uniref:putative O-glycosylation ligase, exosortase A system-associated n=1 Tax=Ferribacterium limneticum TaxID=76259 RepID=UPI001CF9F979|nr:putative O-glycosylation ligase, exosortase A system-associated [Ferribacterium limneticum]UCV17324.1 putative O-glycosylation ligase, exosortase A system-associated [Ferribacterium limneticum]
MRDLILAGIVFGSIPFILRNPFIGLLMWIWLGIMNPHKLTYGFAFFMPFAQVVALSTLASILFHAKKLYSFPKDRVAILLIFFVLWLGVSPLFSFHTELEFEMWLKPIKVLFMCLVALLLVGSREQVHQVIWILALSVGFYGVKGGIFTILTAGAHRVWGPDGTFIADNNTLALAIVMTVPLFRYLQLHSTNKWVRLGCLAAIILCVVSAFGSQSRGAFLALTAMGSFLFIKSRNKGLIAVLVLIAIPMVLMFMPESWFARMQTMKEYEQDQSAMGRINAWWMAWNLAVDRFPIGGGFAVYALDVFARYAPDPSNLKVAHSIYFQILGEHGFGGLALFLLIFILSWSNGAWVVRNAKGGGELLWAYDLAAMCQVSLIGYAVGGAFLSLTYFDLPYYIVIVLIVLRGMVKSALNKEPDMKKTVTN